MTSADDSLVPDYPDLVRLDGRRFVVVGAGLGIGRQTAHALSAAGAHVACVDLEADRADDVPSEVGGVAVVGDATQVPRFVNGPWPAELTVLHHEHGHGEDYWRSLRSALAHSWADHHVTEDELRALEVPTLVVCGDRDRIEPVETALALQRALPHGELLVIPRCGHFVSRERPAELAVGVEGFLARAVGRNDSAAAAGETARR